MLTITSQGRHYCAHFREEEGHREVEQFAQVPWPAKGTAWVQPWRSWLQASGSWITLLHHTGFSFSLWVSKLYYSWISFHHSKEDISLYIVSRTRKHSVRYRWVIGTAERCREGPRNKTWASQGSWGPDWGSCHLPAQRCDLGCWGAPQPPWMTSILNILYFPNVPPFRSAETSLLKEQDFQWQGLSFQL